ncbi:ATP-binding protein [Lacrimispora sp.]|uniref:ATP-binding protein n=1 Tax=Lacrimispora sp. TaxID=2719234 RepID=UPI0028B23786|nr:ATP-binding protein [Lacrimispora sp.]
MDKPIFRIMIGLSASGKSTVAKKIANEDDCVIISSDSIRGEICDGGVIDQTQNDEVFRIFHKRIKDNLRSGKNVIADATNINMKARRSLLENVKSADCHKIAYIVPKSVERCIEDNIYKEYPVPHHVIQKQMMNFQIPFLEEGFDEIQIHRFNKEYELALTDLQIKMIGFNQNNPYHNMTLSNHCTYTGLLFADNYGRDYRDAAYIHDIGKLFTQKFDNNGVAHYYQHENVGSYYLLSNYNNLDIDEQSILNMCFLLNYHMMPMSWDSNKSKLKWKKRFGEYKYQMLLDFNECDKSR